MRIATRFAPSPSGHLHVGGARTALFCWAFAKGRDGTFILRIEDTDQKRSSDAASIGFAKDLHWLGILWDEGPQWQGVGGGPHGPYFQSERLATYNHHLQRLLDAGHAYYAFETGEELDAKRKAATAAGKPYRYDRAALALQPDEVASKLAAGVPAVIRLKCPGHDVTIKDEVLGEATIPATEIDDFVIRKADGFPTYHFAVVVDDELMQVTHVLRAQEHFTNTAKHMLLQDALGFRRPAYAHLPIICNPDGSKMSKRDKDKALRKAVAERKLAEPPAGTVDPAAWTAWLGDKNVQLDLETGQRLADAVGITLPEINVDDFKRSGYLPEVLINFLALNGWSPGNDIEKFDLEFLRTSFDPRRVVKTPAKFDRVKLLSFNCDAITGMPHEEFLRRAIAHGREYHPAFMDRMGEQGIAMLAKASQERSKTLDDMFRGNRFFVVADDALTWERSKNTEKAMLGDAPNGCDHLRALLPVLGGVTEWTSMGIEAAVKPYAEAHAAGQLGKAAQPLRIAVSGGTVSPPIFDTLAILGKASTLRRIERAIAAFTATSA
jgi:glutamyl-tRNA synthetase